MLRFILARSAQVGPDDFGRQHKTVDVDAPAVEALLGPQSPWYFVGLEVLPQIEPALQAEDLMSAPLAAAADAIERLHPAASGGEECGADAQCWVSDDDAETVPLPTPEPAPAPPCDFQHPQPVCAAGWMCYLDIPF